MTGGNAMYEKGMELYRAAGEKVITDEAAEYFLEAAQSGHVRAMYYYGLYCENHLTGMKEKETPAEYWLKKAADAGDTDAQFQLAYYYERDPNRLLLQEGPEALRSQMINWDDSPEYLICKTNMEEYKFRALPYYEKAAAAGHISACFNLGLIRERGIGPEHLERDMIQAEKLYRTAAAAGHTYALCRLAYFYFCGKEVEKDIDEAVRLYRLAAEKGSLEAKFRLGWCYANGAGVEKDEEKALKYYNEAGTHVPWWAVKKKLER